MCEDRLPPVRTMPHGRTKMDAFDGSRISVEWALADGSVATFSATIETRKRKHGACKYKLMFDDGDVRYSRLKGVKWSHATDGSGAIAKRAIRAAGDEKQLPPHKWILAPMVGGSELAFRLLCRRYASSSLLAYTPMMHSDRFVADAAYRNEIFQTNETDRPLVAHFAANDAQTLLAAARLVEASCDAIDLNLGCPQRIAHSGHFGSFLLDDTDRPLVLDMVRQSPEYPDSAAATPSHRCARAPPL